MAGTTSVYLEQYLDSLENLPSELKKNFNRMHDLDTKNKDILVDIDTASDDYLRKVRDLSPTKRKAEMEKIQVWAIAALCVWFYLICVHKRMYRLTTTSQAKLFPIKYLKIYLEFKECWMFHVNFMNALKIFSSKCFLQSNSPWSDIAENVQEGEGDLWWQGQHRGAHLRAGGQTHQETRFRSGQVWIRDEGERLQGHASFASNSVATNFSYLVTKEDGGSGAFIISLHRVLQPSQHPGGRFANQWLNVLYWGSI